jgi:hypothetical protein
MSVVSRIANAMTRSSGAPSTVESLVTTYRISMFESVVAVLAIRVVRSLTARLEERFRRLRNSTAESLAARQIVIDDRVL